MYKKNKNFFLIFFGAVLLTLGLVLILLLTFRPMPFTLLSKFNLDTLWTEGTTMVACAECHKTADFHSCDTCHDDHGAVELSGVTFFEVVELTGDVPDPTFVRINEILPDQKNLGTHITLFEFLRQNGVEQFESVTFTTSDGGLTTIGFEFLDDTAMLVPYMDGVRFITESVHSSTWLKGIKRIIIVGTEKPLTIDGEKTSIGRLLTGETIRLTVEGSEVMLTNDSGETNLAYVANWAEGALLLPHLKTLQPESVYITDVKGATVELSIDEVQNAVIGIVRDKVTLILPNRGRSAWPTEIIEIESN